MCEWSSVTTLLLLCGALMPPAALAADPPTGLWWQSALFYRIFVPSFHDNDADGIGDINGITDKLTYLSNLTVDALVLSPIFGSPNDVGGYDTDNFTAINDALGKLEDLRTLINESHSAGMKVILEIDPNFSSLKHKWFNMSAQRVAPYTDYYVWAGNNSSLLPNNWTTIDGKPAWTWHSKRKQFYYHAFSNLLPDLNFRSEAVRNETTKILKYWLNLGVDGFLILSTPFLVENQTLQNQSQEMPLYTINQPETLELVVEWRKLIDNMSTAGDERILVVEAPVLPDKAISFYGNETTPEAHLVVNEVLIFPTQDKLLSIIFDSVVHIWTDALPPYATSSWATDKGGVPRSASRVSPGAVDALNAMALLLPGAAFAYYGQELGLPDVSAVAERAATRMPKGQSGSAARTAAALANWTYVSHDFSRTLFPWDASTNRGFSNASKVWLPTVPTEFVDAEKQSEDPMSNLMIFKSLLQVTKEGPLTLHIFSTDILMFTRNNTWVIMNFGKYAMSVDFTQMNYSTNCMIVDISNKAANYTVGNAITPNATKMLPAGGLVVLHSCQPPSKGKSAHIEATALSTLLLLAVLTLLPLHALK